MEPVKIRHGGKYVKSSENLKIKILNKKIKKSKDRKMKQIVLLDGTKIEESEIEVLKKTVAWKYLENQIVATLTLDSDGNIENVSTKNVSKAKHHFNELVKAEVREKFPKFDSDYDNDRGNEIVDRLFKTMMNNKTIAGILKEITDDGNRIGEINLTLDHKSAPKVSTEYKSKHGTWKRSNLRIESINQDILTSLKNQAKG